MQLQRHPVMQTDSGCATISRHATYLASLCSKVALLSIHDDERSLNEWFEDHGYPTDNIAFGSVPESSGDFGVDLAIYVSILNVIFFNYDTVILETDLAAAEVKVLAKRVELNLGNPEKEKHLHVYSTGLRTADDLDDLDLSGEDLWLEQQP